MFGNLVAHGVDVLVTTAAHADHQCLVLAHFLGSLDPSPDGMRRFQRGHDAFLERHVLEAEQAVVVRNGDVLSTPNVLEVRVLRSDPGVVQPRANGVPVIWPLAMS